MKTVNLVQGTPEWHNHRALHRNSSEASIMLGEFPSLSRTELLKVRATGIEREISWFLQKIFDDGHRFEALARPLAEEIIGEELYPCVGTAGLLSASFDGLTLLEDIAFEHKTLNNALREAMFDGCTGADLPIYFQIQMEQQCMVSGALKALFMASVWEGGRLIEERHCWYTPNADLRARIVAGWEQFETDVAAYTPEAPSAPAPIGRTPDQLPALRVEVTGMVTASNLAEFRDHAIAVFKGISTELQTDQDFADAEKTVKWCGDIEDQLKAAKQHALSQTASIDELFRTIDAIGAEARAKRLELDKLVKARKESIRIETATTGREAVRAHYDAINANLGAHAISMPATVTADLGAAIKGKKSISSMQEAVSSVVANCKISASQQAERVRANMAILAEHPDHASLFADRVSLCASKAPEDLRNLVAARVTEHKQREADRLEQEREKIRAEEVARIEREQAEDARKAAEEAKPEPVEPAPPAPVAQRPAPTSVSPAPVSVGSAPASAPSAPAGARIKLGEINARIAPLSITEAGLATLGFKAVGVERAAKLYALADLPAMCGAMTDVLTIAGQRREAA